MNKRETLFAVTTVSLLFVLITMFFYFITHFPELVKILGG